MITLEGSSLRFRFPEVHDHANTEIHFQRTLRIPDDGKHYPLPPGLGRFPLEHVEDYSKSVAEMAAEKGEQVLGPDGEVDPSTIVVLGPGKIKPQTSRPVRECQV